MSPPDSEQHAGMPREPRWQLMLRRADELIPALAFALLAGHALIFLIIPYWTGHTLLEGDTPGHLFLAHVVREQLLPWMSGWNDGLWLGFPQDQLYPPLGHVAVGLLGALVEDETALRLLVTLALVAVFSTAFALGRRLGLSRWGAMALSALVWVVGTLSATHMGTDLAYGMNLESTLSAGMVVAGFGLPLLLATLAAMSAGPDRRRHGRLLAVAALLALTLLTHFVAGLAAILFLGCRTLVAVSGPASRRREALRWYVGGGVVAAALAAFWWAPLVWHRSLISAEPIGLRWTPAEVASLAAALIFAVAGWWFSRRRGTPDEREARAAWALFTVLVAAATVLVDRLELGTHAYRFLPLVWVGGAVGLGLLFRAIPSLAGLVAIGAFFALYPGAQLPAPDRTDMELQRPPRVLPEASRVLVAVPEGHSPGYQYVQHRVALWEGVSASHGISVESARTNAAIFNVLQEAHRDIPIWSVYPPAAPPLDGDAQRGDRWLRKVRQLGFTHVLTDLDLGTLLGTAAEQLVDVATVGSYPAPIQASAMWGLPFHLNRTGVELHLYAFVTPPPLATALEEAPEVVAPELFERAAMAHWLQGAPEHVVTDAAVAATAPVATPDTTVRVERVRRHAVFLDVDAPHPVPVLVRVAWHPAWRATSDAGPLEVYRASPSFILVYGHGAISLVWEHDAVTWAGAGVSALAWLSMIVAAVAAGLRRRKLGRLS